MVQLQCQNCGDVKETDNPPKKKFVCSKCGAVNTIVSENTSTGPQACGCLLPTGFEWKEPAGVISTPAGDLYVCPDDGSQMTRLEWIEDYGCDPKIIRDWMKNHRAPPGYKRLGKGIV